MNKFHFYLIDSRIVNTLNGTSIGVRLKKFNIGKLNRKTGLCEDAWLDFYEDDDFYKYSEKISELFSFNFIKQNFQKLTYHRY